MDIAFSDHRIPLSNLKQFGEVIRSINAACDDPETRFWAFISYVSRNHDELLTATPPPELQDRVDQVLTSTNLPSVDLRLKETPADEEPPTKTIKLPQPLFDRFSAANNFFAVASVQIRDRKGEIHPAMLMDDDGPLLICREDSTLTLDDIAAIRKTPGCLIGWLIKPRWTNTEMRDN